MSATTLDAAPTSLRLSVAEGLLLSLTERPTKAVVDNATALLEARSNGARGMRFVVGSAKATHGEVAETKTRLKREIRRLRRLVEADTKADTIIDPTTTHEVVPNPKIKLKQPHSCPSCGATLPAGSAACPSCGADVSKTSSAAATPPLTNLNDGDSHANPAPGGPDKPPRSGSPILQAAVETPKVKSIAKPAGGPKGRGGKKPGGKPVGSADFDQLHPRNPKGRTGGGEFAKKGDGTGKDGPSPVVGQLQDRLAQLGYKLQKDGQFGPNTEAVVKQFQHDYGLKETGKVDAATTETLRNPPAEKVPKVIAEKKALAKASRSSSSGSSSSTGGATTTLNTKDSKAVERFQRANGLTVDGIVGPETRQAMKDAGVTSGSGSTSTRVKGKRTNLPGVGSIGGGDLKLGVGMGVKADGNVKTLQKALDDLGFDLGEAGVDGRYGPDTAHAVRELQSKYGITVDGVVGPETKALLKRIEKRHQKAKNKLDVRRLVSETKIKATVPRTVTKTGRTAMAASIEKRLGEAVAARKAATTGSDFVRARARESVLRKQLAEAQFSHFDSMDGAYHTVICDGCKKSGGLSRLSMSQVGDLVHAHFECANCGTVTTVKNSADESIKDGSSRENNIQKGPSGFATLDVDPGGAAANENIGEGLYSEAQHPRGRGGEWIDVLNKLELGQQKRVGTKTITRLRTSGREQFRVDSAMTTRGAGIRFDTAEDVAQHALGIRTPKQQERFDAATRKVQRLAQDRHIVNQNVGVKKEEDAIKAMMREPGIGEMISNYVKMHGKAPSEAQLKSLRKRAGLSEAADSIAKASTPEPFSTSKTSNWVARGGGLPAYIQHIAHDIMEKRGKSESNAIQIAIGVVKRWAKGVGNVDANTRAAAAKAVAEWEALKAKSKGAKAAGHALAAADDSAVLVDLEEVEAAADRLPARVLLEAMADLAGASD